MESRDQRQGLQADLKRDYIVLTRGRHKTTRWLEDQPCGTPKTMDAAKRMRTGHPSNINSSAVEHFQKLNTLLAGGERWPWYRLTAGARWSNWRASYRKAFGWDVDPEQGRQNEEAMGRAWCYCSEGSSPLPKLGTPADQFADIFQTFEAILHNSGELGDFCGASNNDVRARGFDTSKAAWFVPLPDDTRIKPAEADLGLALGFGVLMCPCLCVQLSAHPKKGVTTVALPFMSLEGFRDSKHLWPLVEDMFPCFAAVVWRVCELVATKLLEGGEPKLAHHKVEVVNEETPSEFWFNKSCESNRVAPVFFQGEEKR